MSIKHDLLVATDVKRVQSDIKVRIFIDRLRDRKYFCSNSP